MTAERDVASGWPTAGWRTSTPASQGVSSDALVALLEFGASNDLDSALVVRGGAIVLEASYAPYRHDLRHALNSATKGVIGSLIGIAQRRGLLGLDDAVADAFPGCASDWSAHGVTVQHLLDMTSGLDWQEPLTGLPVTAMQMEASPDWTGFVLERAVVQTPGNAFRYNSGNSHLLSALLAQKTGQSTLDFARSSLFEPLGITDVAWREDPTGIPIGGYGLSLTPRDMAKLGYLHLRRGEWEGQQLLDPAWIARIERGAVDMDLPAPLRYANGWWSMPTQRAYMAVGFHRQVIMVLPELDVVAVVTGRKNYPLGTLVELLSSAVVGGGRAPDDAPAQRRLQARIEALATQRPSAPPAALPETAARISGLVYTFAPNPSGMQTLRLQQVGTALHQECRVSAGVMGVLHTCGPVGLDGTFLMDDSLPGPLVASRGRWLDDHRLSIETRLVCDGMTARYELTFQDRQVHVSFESERGPRAELDGVARDAYSEGCAGEKPRIAAAKDQ